MLWLKFCHCRGNQWSYLFTQKETRQKVLVRDYRELEAEDLNEVKSISKEQGSGRFYHGIGEISGKKETMNIFEYSYEQETRDGVSRSCFQWITVLEVTKRNLEELVETAEYKKYIFAVNVDNVPQLAMNCGFVWSTEKCRCFRTA